MGSAGGYYGAGYQGGSAGGLGGSAGGGYAPSGAAYTDGYSAAYGPAQFPVASRPAPVARGYYRPAQRDVANLIVRVPADARVYVQDQAMTMTGPVRHFVTPRLSDDSEYLYNIRVVIERDGRELTKTAQARLRAGQNLEINVSFDDVARNLSSATRR